jgi:hypothetical protein
MASFQIFAAAFVSAGNARELNPTRFSNNYPQGECMATPEAAGG